MVNDLTEFLVKEKKDKEKLKLGASSKEVARTLLRVDFPTVDEINSFALSGTMDSASITTSENVTVDSTADINSDDIVGAVSIGDVFSGATGPGVFRLGLGNSRLSISRTNGSGYYIPEQIRIIDVDLGAGSVIRTVNY